MPAAARSGKPGGAPTDHFPGRCDACEPLHIGGPASFGELSIVGTEGGSRQRLAVIAPQRGHDRQRQGGDRIAGGIANAGCKGSAVGEVGIGEGLVEGRHDGGATVGGGEDRPPVSGGLSAVKLSQNFCSMGAAATRRPSAVG